MDRVYLVTGESGEYSDYSTWPVRAFDTEGEARDYVEVCEAAAKARPKHPGWSGTREENEAADLRWRERLTAFIATCPDDQMPRRDAVYYNYQTVPFGLESTALATAPPRLSQRSRKYDLTTDHES